MRSASPAPACDRGATAVEYALYVFLVGIAMFLGVAGLNAALGATLTAVAADPMMGGTSSVAGTEDAADQGAGTEDAGTENGDAAGELTSQAPATTPGQVRSLSASGGVKGALAVTWAVPENDGGTDILGYDVEIDSRSGRSDCANSFRSSGDQTVLTTNADFSGLTGSRYCVRVRAINAEGRGQWVEGGPFDVAALVEPNKPETVQGSSTGAGILTVTWDDGGNDADTTYEVAILDRSGNSGSSCPADYVNYTSLQTTRSTSFESTGLTGTRYCAAVRATNEAGETDWVRTGAPVTIQQAATAPGAPSITKASPDKYSVELKWNAPANDGGADITHYVVEFRESGDRDWSVAKDDVEDRQYTVPNLSKNTEHDFRVAAVNSAGMSQYSDVVSVKTDRR
jgi:Flp pilus assembly pilin Flp